jgi:hypothetical protein
MLIGSVILGCRICIEDYCNGLGFVIGIRISRDGKKDLPQDGSYWIDGLRIRKVMDNLLLLVLLLIYYQF